LSSTCLIRVKRYFLSKRASIPSGMCSFILLEDVKASKL
jgi:hypothetical protein